MNTYQITALRARPPFPFVPYEMSYAELPDVLKIMNHAHAIFGSIPLV